MITLIRRKIVTQVLDNQRMWSQCASAVTVSANFKEHTYCCLKKPRKAQEGLNLNGNDRAGGYYFLENTERSQDRETETESSKFSF